MKFRIYPEQETTYRVVSNLGPKATDKIPVLPDGLGTITKAWLIRWAEWVAAGKPEIDRQAQNDFTPSLHPRDPRTGQFVERSFNVPDDIPDFGNMSSPEILSYLNDQGEDIESVLRDDGVSIDGVPMDISSVDDLPTPGDTLEPEELGATLTDSGVSQLSQGDVVAIDGERATVVDSSTHFIEVRRNGETEVLPTIQHQIKAIDTSLEGVDPEIDAVGRVDEILEESDAPHTDLESHIEEVGGLNTVNLPVLDEGKDREEMFKTLAKAADSGLLGETTQMQIIGGESHGSYTFNFKSFNVNREVSSEELEGLTDENFSVGESIEWLVLHELGHANHHSNIGDVTDADEYLFDGSLASTRDGEFVGRDRLDLVEEEVSKYARTSPIELVAEVFAGKALGQDYPDEVMKIYDEMDGPDNWSDYRNA